MSSSGFGHSSDFYCYAKPLSKDLLGIYWNAMHAVSFITSPCMSLTFLVFTNIAFDVLVVDSCDFLTFGPNNHKMRSFVCNSCLSDAPMCLNWYVGAELRAFAQLLC